jgi:hypothetical protein
MTERGGRTESKAKLAAFASAAELARRTAYAASFAFPIRVRLMFWI